MSSLRRGAVLAPVPRQPIPALLESHVPGVVVSFGFSQALRQICGDLLNEAVGALRVVAAVLERLANVVAPGFQSLSEFPKVLVDSIRGAKVRQEKPRGVSRPDLLQALLPRLQVDIGRRSDGRNVSPVGDSYAARITDEGNPVGRVEVAHMMPGMTRRVHHLQSAASDANPLATGQSLHVARRHGQDLSPEPIHLCSVQPGSALDQPRRINQVRRSEEHTSELQSRLHLVCRLLLEKKKTKQQQHTEMYEQQPS